MDILDAARYFLSLPDSEVESYLTHLKLQKLCYYAQARSLVYRDKPLFNERFEAWKHGPVSPTVYQEYRQFQGNPIPKPQNTSFAILEEDQQILDEVWAEYGIYDPKFLVDLSHQETPWLKARGDLGPEEYCNRTIDEKEIKFYYRAKHYAEHVQHTTLLSAQLTQSLDQDDLLDKITSKNLHKELDADDYRMGNELL